MTKEEKAANRKRRKEIEKILHSKKILFGKVEILHEHLRGPEPRLIRFSAWEGNNPLNNKGLNFFEEDIDENFLNCRQEDFAWLADSGKK